MVSQENGQGQRFFCTNEKSVSQGCCSGHSVGYLLFIARASGDFDSMDAFLNFIRDVFSGSILPLVRTILIGVGSLVGLCFAASGAGRFCHRSPGERRNQADMLLIDQRAEDLGFKKKEWNRAKRQQKGVN